MLVEETEETNRPEKQKQNTRQIIAICSKSYEGNKEGARERTWRGSYFVAT